MTVVNVIVPAYNEGADLAASLTELAEEYSRYAAAGYTFRYVIVDDGSADETGAVADIFAQTHQNVTVVRHERNRGLGAAMRTAFAAVDEGYALVIDADLSYSPSVGMQLIEELERSDAEVAVASPYLRGGTVRNVPLVRRIMSREANRILSMATAGRYATLTSVVRAYRVDVIRTLDFVRDGTEAVAEILLLAIRRGMRIVEVPALLQWSEARRAQPSRLQPLRALRQALVTFAMAFEHRPSLWLAVPGLIPGLLPLVVAIFIIAHASAETIMIATLATLVVQYLSLAIFAGQLGGFVKRSLLRQPSSSTRINTRC
jgi:glycosyltransferase involved in cell wall biosynthesis